MNALLSAAAAALHSTVRNDDRGALPASVR